MFLRDVIYLIQQDPDPHGFTDTVTETKHMVYVTVRSVGHTEVYEALTQGLRPSLIFRIGNFADYRGERYVEYNSKRYRVIRTYRTGFAIDLTVEEAPDVQ